MKWLWDELEQHGKEYPWIGKLPKGFARMRQKACFSNAQQLVLQREGLRYAEGEAWKEGMWRPCHHAWVLNEDDQVIDCTWTKREQSPRKYVAAVIWTRDELTDHLIEMQGSYFWPYMCCMSDWCWCINLLGREEDEKE